MENCPDARTQEEQNAISPKEAVQMLKDGNQRFVEDKMINYCYGKMAKQTAKNGQFPFAAVLACVDSRIPVEQVFDQAIGDMFVARVAGNFMNTDIVGSLEFAVASGVKTILILGHTACGAVKGACDGATGFPALDSMLSNIEPAVKSAITSTGSVATSTDPAFVQQVADVNVKIAMANLRSQSSLINNAIQDGDLKLVGGMYDLSSRIAEIDG
jgi:carbonic anhydrase